MSWLWRLLICFPSKVTAQLHITISNNQEVSHSGLPLLTILIYSSLLAAKVIQKIKQQTIWKVAFETKSGSFLHNTFKLGFPKGLLHFLLLETKRQESLPFPVEQLSKPSSPGPKSSQDYQFTSLLSVTHSSLCFCHRAVALRSYINVISRATVQRNSCCKKVKSPSVILV